VISAAFFVLFATISAQTYAGWRLGAGDLKSATQLFPHKMNITPHYPFSVGLLHTVGSLNKSRNNPGLDLTF
jgi:hypothetical protein